MKVIEITEKAKDRLLHLLNQNDENMIMVYLTNKGCGGKSYAMEFIDSEKLKPLDEKVELDDNKFLVIDNKSFLFLFNSTLDWEDDRFNSRFIWTNPNSKGECGCGESFTI